MSRKCLVLLVLPLIACGVDDPTHKEPRILAHVELGDEGFVDFLENVDGSIGIVQLSPETTPMYTADLMRQHDASPLEVFLAIAPDEEVPPELEDDAFRSGHGGPRDLRDALSNSSGGCVSDVGWNSYWEVASDLYLNHPDNSKWTSTTVTHVTHTVPADSNRLYALCHLSSELDEDQSFSIVTDVGNYWFYWPTYAVADSYYLTYSTYGGSQQYARVLADPYASTYWLALAWTSA